MTTTRNDAKNIVLRTLSFPISVIGVILLYYSFFWLEFARDNEQKVCLISDEEGFLKESCSFYSGTNETLIGRQCGQEIFYLGRRSIQLLTWMIIKGAGKTFAPMDIIQTLIRNSNDHSTFNISAKYGVRAIKICAKCDDYSRTIESDYFKEYCGNNVYGHNETISGVLYLPIDDSTDLPPQKTLSTYVFMRASVTAHGPSVTLPRSLIGAFSQMAQMFLQFVKAGVDGAYDNNAKNLINQATALALGSKGVISIAPDYIGTSNVGPNTNLFKGQYVIRAYQTGTIPLYFKTRELVHSLGKFTTMDNRVFVHGASEGGFSAVAVADAFDKLGLHAEAFPAVPAYDLSKSMFKGIFNFLDGTCASLFYSFLAYGATPFNYGSPYTNVSLSESIFSKEGIDSIFKIVNSNVTLSTANNLLWERGMEYKPECLKKGKNCTKLLNPVLTRNLLKLKDIDLVENPEYLPCSRMNPAPELSSLCKALKSNNIEDLISSANYPVKLCFPESEVFSPFIDLPWKYAHNKNLSHLPSQEEWKATEKIRGDTYKHAASSFLCGLVAMRDIMKTLNI